MNAFLAKSLADIKKSRKALSSVLPRGDLYVLYWGGDVPIFVKVNRSTGESQTAPLYHATTFDTRDVRKWHEEGRYVENGLRIRATFISLDRAIRLAEASYRSVIEMLEKHTK